MKPSTFIHDSVRALFRQFMEKFQGNTAVSGVEYFIGLMLININHKDDKQRQKEMCELSCADFQVSLRLIDVVPGGLYYMPCAVNLQFNTTELSEKSRELIGRPIQVIDQPEKKRVLRAAELCFQQKLAQAPKGPSSVASVVLPFTAEYFARNVNSDELLEELGKQFSPPGSMKLSLSLRKTPCRWGMGMQTIADIYPDEVTVHIGNRKD